MKFTSSRLGAPIIGVLPQFIRNPLSLLEQARAAGDVCRLSLGVTEVVTVHHPQLASHVLRDNNKNYTKEGTLFSAARELLGTGLPVSTGEHWLRQRRMMQPHFQHHRLGALLPSIIEAIDGSMSWRDVGSDWSILGVGARMPHVALNVTSAALLGTATSKEEADRITSSMRYATEQMFRAIVTSRLPSWAPGLGRDKFSHAVATLRDLVAALIDQRRRDRGDAHNDLLALLIDTTDSETGSQMNDAQLVDEVLGIFIASYETTAAALAWSIHLISEHPDCAKRLQDEVDAVLGDDPPSHASLAGLVYARQVFQEALRMYPPAWWIPRTTIHEDVIGGCRVSPGAMVIPVTYTIQRHPSFWKDPDWFDPDRFAPSGSGTQKRHPLEWFPFGAGSRKCIGQEFALIEGQLVLAMLAQRYDLKAASRANVRPHVSMVLRPSNEVPVGIRLRRR